MQAIWAIICQTSIIDKDTNSVSLINVIEEIITPANPPVVKNSPSYEGKVYLAQELFELVILWSRSDADVPERGEARIRLVTPKGNQTTITTGEVDLTRYLRLRVRTHFPGLPYAEDFEGIYNFVIEARNESGDWEEKFKLPLRVAVQSQDLA